MTLAEKDEMNAKCGCVLGLIVLSSVAARAPIRPERTIPLHLAEDAVLAAQKEFPDDKQSRYGFIDAYGMAYLDAWRFGERREDVQRGFPNAALEKGYAAGKKALNEGAPGFSTSPADFGYLIRELEGECTYGSEKSEFVVRATGEHFHLNPGHETRLPAGPIRIRAYVSPETALGFGHFGQWKREIIVIKVLDPNEDEGAPADAGSPSRDAPPPAP